MLFGLGLHTMMDGVALAASVVAEAGHAAWLGLAGLGTFLAVALHEPLDAFSITSVMKKGGWSSYQRTLVNLVFAHDLSDWRHALLFRHSAAFRQCDATWDWDWPPRRASSFAFRWPTCCRKCHSTITTG